MRYKTFWFENFRGIKFAELNLAKKSHSRINVLVGLNESGKTTVLEAIHHFRSNPDLSKKTPSLKRRTPSDYQAMLPISERHLFDGAIEITALVEIEDDDWDQIDKYLRENFGFLKTEQVREFEINHQIKFVNSNFNAIENVWSIQFEGKKSARARNLVSLEGEDWLKAANFVGKLLPQIVYFPASLFEFPDKIILEKGELQEPRNDFYCGVFEDVLRAINPGLKLQDHLVARVKSADKSEQENLEALLQKIGDELKRVIVGEWNAISSDKAAELDFRVYISNARGQISISIKIKTAEGIFSVNEKSAGFRWFFAYVLLTKYRLHRKDRVLFLFDEPAANLHPNAQALLLKSFEMLSRDSDIIYSTHSHYLINPLWLEFTHIVTNGSSEVGRGVLYESHAKNTITVVPYRTFVGSHPEQYFYYKPIYDALDYSPSPVEFPNNVVLVEGKTDFFALKYFLDVAMAGVLDLNVFPGGGAGSLDPLISMLSGWGKNFVVLVDSDTAGEKQKKRYMDKFEALVQGRLFSFADVVGVNDLRIEAFITEDDKERLRVEFFSGQIKLSKAHLHLAMQELIASGRMFTFSKETVDNFSKILNFLFVQIGGLAQYSRRGIKKGAGAVKSG